MKTRLVLLPDKKLDELSRKYSSFISDKYSSYFKLDEKHIPHITVAAFELESDLLPNIKRLIDTLLKRAYNFTIKTAEIKASHSGFIGIYFEKDTTIRKLQIDASSLLRAEFTLTEKKRDPHLTLTRLKNEENVKNAINAVKDFKKQTSDLNYLAVCLEGDNGTCKEILYKIKLI